MSSTFEQPTDDLQLPQRQMLKAAMPSDPRKLVEDHLREIGQAFEWSIEQVHTTKFALATDMGYTDQSVVGRWIGGKERIQLDKLRMFARPLYREFLLTLLQMEDGVEVKTLVTLRRVV